VAIGQVDAPQFFAEQMKDWPALALTGRNRKSVDREPCIGFEGEFTNQPRKGKSGQGAWS